jgi:hypothetical protein
MNVLIPILIIGIGAGVWYLIREVFHAPRGFEIALYVVLAIALVLWVLATFGGFSLYVPIPGARTG